MKRFALRTLAVLLLLVIGLGLWFWTPDRDADELRDVYANQESRILTLENGLTLHLRDEGPRDAPVVMLLHGSNASLHTWEPWVERLSEDYRIVSFDQAGHGLTGANPDGDYSDALFVETVDAVADALDLDRFVLGGNSMGGAVAWRYAVDHGNRLDGLILVDASGAPSVEPDNVPIGFRLARMPVISSILQNITPRSIIEQSLRQSVSNEAMIDEAMIDRYYDLLLHPGNRAATFARFRAPRSTTDPQSVAGIDVPTLILWGEQDLLIPLSAGQWFDRTIPESELIVYSEIGHIPMEEAADESAADVRHWLETLYEPEIADSSP